MRAAAEGIHVEAGGNDRAMLLPLEPMAGCGDKAASTDA